MRISTLPKLPVFILLAMFFILVAGCSNTGLVEEDPQDEITFINQSENSVDVKDRGDTAERSKYVDIKYRDTPVDIAATRFEYMDTTGSSFIRGAWYDQFH